MRTDITWLKTILTLAVVSCVLLVLYRPSVWTGFLFILVAVLVSVCAKRAPRPLAAAQGIPASQPIAPPPANELPPASAREQSFENDVTRFGVKAKRFSARKVLDKFGTSSFHYKLEDLEVTQGELTGLHFFVESTAGYVTRPKLEAGQFRVTWKDDSNCRTQTLAIDEAVECTRKLSGAFRFDKLRPGDPPLSFQWSFTVLNCDALSEWEYSQLYGEEPDQDPVLPHVGGRAEYFARVVWFPIETFCMSVTLPSRVAERPSLSVERLKGDVKIPRDQVVRDSVLQVYPRGDSEWVRDEVRWERDWSAEKIDGSLLKHVPEEASLIEVRKPLVGSRYLLGWPIPGTDRAPEFEFLVGRSQEVRQKSLEHAGHRRRHETATAVEEIKKLFQAFDEEIRSQYALGADREQFTTTLMTYDQGRRRLAVVESRINGQEIEPAGWEFSLPFGFGLSGACFKEGNNAFMYVRSADKNADDVKYYLQVQGTVSYQILLALPVDHRDFAQPKPENGEPAWERSRQLIGVVSVGSSSPSSNLHEYAIEIGKARKTPSEGRIDQPPAMAEKLHRLCERCQKLGDDICDLLQPRSVTAQK